MASAVLRKDYSNGLVHNQAIIYSQHAYHLVDIVARLSDVKVRVFLNGNIFCSTSLGDVKQALNDLSIAKQSANEKSTIAFLEKEENIAEFMGEEQTPSTSPKSMHTRLLDEIEERDAMLKIMRLAGSPSDTEQISTTDVENTPELVAHDRHEQGYMYLTGDPQEEEGVVVLLRPHLYSCYCTCKVAQSGEDCEHRNFVDRYFDGIRPSFSEQIEFDKALKEEEEGKFYAETHTSTELNLIGHLVESHMTYHHYYRVWTNENGTHVSCSCPDFQYQGGTEGYQCKHMRGMNLDLCPYCKGEAPSGVELSIDAPIEEEVAVDGSGCEAEWNEDIEELSYDEEWIEPIPERYLTDRRECASCKQMVDENTLKSHVCPSLPKEDVQRLMERAPLNGNRGFNLMR